jgi:hypothetical protein
MIKTGLIFGPAIKRKANDKVGIANRGIANRRRFMVKVKAD